MTAEERTTVMNLMEMDDSELENAVVIPITMEQESAYMGETDGTELYGSASKSCVRITTTSPGSGLQISMHNIDYCTEEMYRQELQKIGIYCYRIAKTRLPYMGNEPIHSINISSQ